MGLILTGGVLVVFYIIKLICPQFIVGVAELPTIVKFGTFIDNNIFAYHIFNIAVGYLFGYIYCCAGCMKKKLNLKNNIILICVVLFLSLVLAFLPQHYNSVNYVSLAILPFLMNYFDKNLSKYTYISSVICFVVEISSQVLSSLIRDLFVYTTHINSATLTVLLIDVWIWRGLLYMFFNNVKEN